MGEAPHPGVADWKVQIPEFLVEHVQGRQTNPCPHKTPRKKKNRKEKKKKKIFLLLLLIFKLSFHFSVFLIYQKATYFFYYSCEKDRSLTNTRV